MNKPIKATIETFTPFGERMELMLDVDSIAAMHLSEEDSSKIKIHLKGGQILDIRTVSNPKIVYEWVKEIINANY